MYLRKSIFMLNFVNCIRFFIIVHSKISSTNTSLIELDSQNYIEGIYIDVFPLDGCSNEFADFKKDMDYFRSYLFSVYLVVANYLTIAALAFLSAKVLQISDTAKNYPAEFC